MSWIYEPKNEQRRNNKSNKYNNKKDVGCMQYNVYEWVISTIIVTLFNDIVVLCIVVVVFL